MFDLYAQLGLSDFDAHLSYVTKTGNIMQLNLINIIIWSSVMVHNAVGYQNLCGALVLLRRGSVAHG